MKKIIFFIICLFTLNIYANQIYNIDIEVNIDKKANAFITEKWHVKGTNGTEWYKPLRNLGKSKLTNFTVSMDGEELLMKKWNINETLQEKSGYYGINYTNNDTELCFGKGDFNEHTFILKYQLSNYIFKTQDADVLYWTYLPVLQNVNFKNMSVTIKSYYPFPDTLDVWGYGYEGYAFVKNGLIRLQNNENISMNGNYVVALAKFPLNTFDTNYTVDEFKTFDDVLNTSQRGSTPHTSSDYIDNENTHYEVISNSNNDDHDALLMSGIGILSFTSIVTIIGFSISHIGYGYKNNKKIKYKDIPYFRDIPCNKDLYYANALLYLNDFNTNETNIMGAIILKWIKEKKISFIKNQTKFLKKEKNSLDLRGNSLFTNENERKLFNMMYNASRDGILENKELERWAHNNYKKFFNLFKEIKEQEIKKLRMEGHIYKRTDKKECKKKQVMDDIIYNDSVKLLGLKKFLLNFSSLSEKEVKEIHIWDEYLMFAYLLGIADKVYKQLNKLYPTLLQEYNLDYNTFVIINNMSRSATHSAQSAKQMAESYSSGGGGFSSSGGGGGSFGGGGFSGGGSR